MSQSKGIVMNPRSQMIEPSPRCTFISALQQFGFSQYEAQCYLGLLANEPQTGYAVAKATGVPQPKAYEALRKLVGRGAAYEVKGSPVRFIPIPPNKLLHQLEASVSKQFTAAREAISSIVDQELPGVTILVQISDREAIMAAARRLILESNRRLYISAGHSQLVDIESEIRAASDRSVDIIILCFGQMPFTDSRLRIYRHASTDGVIFRHHQAQHIAVIGDSRSILWALAADGKDWSAIETEDALIVAALKGFVRHDIDMQQVFDDFAPELIARYGQGLEGLSRYRQQSTVLPVQEKSAEPKRSRTVNRAG
jgi:sugar-specific transcriptional regulator TrmB